MNTKSRRPRPAHLAPEHHLATGRRLAVLRKHAGISQASLGKAIGRTQNKIAQLETGNTRLLFAEAVEIAEVLEVDVRLLDPAIPLFRSVGPREPYGPGSAGRQMPLPLAWARPTERRAAGER